MTRRFRLGLLAASCAACASSAHAQSVQDQADPFLIQRDLSRTTEQLKRREPAPIVAPDNAATVASVRGITAGAIIVSGSGVFPAALFAPIFGDFIGRPLSATDLETLVSRVSATARAQGYVFATARIDPQSVRAGVLTITLDEGKIDAVRALGPESNAVNRLLGRLANGKPMTKKLLERTILLVEDVPGVRVVESRYVRQNGFGILLVTIAQDRASIALLADNRGTEEVGPIRATALVSYRGAAIPGDETTLLVANTPIDPSEFIFVQGRYAVPIGLDGSAVSVAATYGRTHPGGALKPFDVIGHSKAVSIAVNHPVVRSRRASLWANLELERLETDQSVLGVSVRRDRLTTVEGSLNGTTTVAGGALAGELSIIAGLPIGHVTRAGDPLSSRLDGDARFVRGGYYVEWTRPLPANFSLALASAGQIASRPLLAVEEFGIGGGAFGRAYDYSERTGENGIAGSAELRFDVGDLGAMFQELQLYAFADGATVGNVRGGFGGGSLVSAGGGARVSVMRALRFGVEVAAPVNTDRFDTQNKHPRVTARASAYF